ncbi:MAG: imidazoleglycerol-phosphate dehydratase HisB [Actinobacteria bacterium]|nr:imidazoleglycerol-phosphate dehydratase HisB [Actinomycetota bacterium]
MERKAAVERETKETSINMELDLDGTGTSEISTGIPFFDHMLELMFRNALINVKLKAEGDLEVDGHHTVEDVGLAAGEALKGALGVKEGITRYGWSLVPMDESLARVSMDISGRPFLEYDIDLKTEPLGNFDPELSRDFFQALVNEASITLHIKLIYGKGLHHGLEAVYKAVGRAFRQAVQIDPRERGIPSTKGTL